MAIKIFFSHAWADKAGSTVKTLMNTLKKDDHYEVWLDRYQIDLAEDIDATIEEAIKETDIVVVAWSKNANSNKHVNQELEVAKRLKKPIVPCIIDGFPTESSKLLKGLKWIEITGDPKLDMPQLTFLHDHLIKLGLEKLESGTKSPVIKKEIEELKRTQKQSSDLLKELEDIHYRQKIGVSGNEGSDAYVQSALTEAIRLSSLNSTDKIQEFFKRMMEATEKFPGLESNQKKIEYLFQTIHDLDPEGEDEAFKKFYSAALQSLNNESAGIETTSASTGSKQMQFREKVENNETPSGNFYDNEFYGIRLYIGDSVIKEKYNNGCKVEFPQYGSVTIYFLYNFLEQTEAITTFIATCLSRMQNDGIAVQHAHDFDYPSANSAALEMAYYNSEGIAQYEYLGGYTISDGRGFFIEIISNEENAVQLFKKIFTESIYLLDAIKPPVEKNSNYQRLVNKKLLMLSSSSSGYGSGYSSSSTQKHFRLFDTGEFDYYYNAANYASGVASFNSEQNGYGRWGVYTENKIDYIWFKWQEGTYEVCEMAFGNDADIFIGEAKYFIVSLDYKP